MSDRSGTDLPTAASGRRHVSMLLPTVQPPSNLSSSSLSGMVLGQSMDGRAMDSRGLGDSTAEGAYSRHAPATDWAGAQSVRRRSVPEAVALGRGDAFQSGA